MSQMFRTTLRLDLDKPASANAVALLRQLHAERGLSYSALIMVVPPIASSSIQSDEPDDDDLDDDLDSFGC